MRTRGLGFVGIGLFLALAGPLAAKDALAECGTSGTRAQEDMFLHWRSTVQRARARLLSPAGAQAAGIQPAGIQQDVGDIAVIDAGGGVVATRNPFDLEARTIAFVPGTAGYTVELGDDTFDTAAAGARLNLADDDTRNFTLPFAFPFYGTTYTQAWVNSNGTVTFTAGDTSYAISFGHFTAGPPVIAGLFSDLDPSASSSGVQLLTAPDRVTVTWNSVPLAGSSFGGNTFQIRLYAAGRIEIAYRTASADPGVIGVAPGSEQPATLVHFSSQPAGAFPSGVAELFSSSTRVDLVAAALRFYQTHGDAYDYLVFYNAMNIPAASGVVAFELTTRSSGEGYGDFAVDTGADYGSPRRLQAVLNLGPTSQYPQNPDGTVPSRGSVGDTPLTIMAHEAGHLFLALVSVPNPTNPYAPPPMLGAALAHWAFPFNSQASFLEGNRIVDSGPAITPRFYTTGTVERYSELDQYLMGFRDPQDVAPMFAVLDSGNSNSRTPQTGVGFNGTRLDIKIEDVIQAAGRRTPDATVAQRHFRMGVVVIVPEGADLSPGTPIAGAIAQVEAYRSRFGEFFANGASGRATIDTTLRRNVSLSLFPNAGIVLGAGGQAALTIDRPAATPLSFALETPQSVLQVPASVTIPAGQTQVTFPVTGIRVGVEEFAAVPADASYYRASARVQVNQASSLRVRIESGDKQQAVNGALPQPVVVRVADVNKVPYSGVTVQAVASAGGRVEPSSAVTDESGRASFTWTPAPGGINTLVTSVAGAPSSAATAVALAAPQIAAVVHAAAFAPRIAPGGFGTIFGGSLAAGATASSSAPFTTVLAGVRVRIDGQAVRLLYVSDFQVNFLAPANLLPGSSQVEVETSLGISDAFPVEVDARAPGIFYDAASGYGAILIAGTSTVTQLRAAAAGEFIEVYCTGLGPAPTATATIGGNPATVTFAGASSISGLDQVNIQIPAGLSRGAQDLTLTVDGIASNTVKVGIAGP